MGTNTPAVGGEKKPAIENEGGNAAGSQCRVNYNIFNRRFAEKKKFLRTDPDLQGFVFEVVVHMAQQNFTTVDTHIKAIIGQNCNHHVLESIEKMAATLPKEPEMETEAGKTKKRAAEMKFKIKYDSCRTRSEKIEKELNQVYSKYFGQCNEDMKATLTRGLQFW